MEADVPEIVVVAPLLPEAPGEATYSTIEIDPAAIYSAVRLDEALRGAPGVSLFRRNDSVVSNPTIQGLSIRSIAPSGAGRALVTLDGQPMNDPFGGWVIWGALPTETIAAATVLRGGGAGPYGAGALTGAVNLRERRGQGATRVAGLASGVLIRCSSASMISASTTWSSRMDGLCSRANATSTTVCSCSS